MNDTAIKNYAVWARRELMGEVEKRCAWWGVSEGADKDLDTIDGRVLGAQEREQRKELLKMVKADGYAQLVERAAYTWFNRMLAIRFMEVNDRLPGHVRVLSAADGTFEPQCLAEALDLRLDALDRDEALRLVQEGDDEALFRLVFLAQCDELARCMPDVFEPVGSAMELLLPTGLLRADGVVGRLVGDIDEADWREGVEIVGWMYQYYVSERKDEVFASFKRGKKAERDAIAPATQLFTPHWIVRYLTENSLGRLWMLNHPESKLTEQMPYYVKPDEEHETKFRDISSPEEITVVDPACGSGHILVYAFDLLLAMYRESGYRDRDAVRSIVERNLTGLEIDRRAAAMASFALTMKACEADGRFLRRKVTPRITVLERVEFTDEELEVVPNLAGNKDLLDAVAHLDECGSLLQVSESDMDDIKGDLASLAKEDSIFARSAEAKLVRLRDELAPLAARYDIVVANPPYMGGSNMNRWVAGWAKKAYPTTKRDLCTCFIERGFTLAIAEGYEAMVSMQAWMFISSFEKLRTSVLNDRTILTLIDTTSTGYHQDNFTANAAFVLSMTNVPGLQGSYFKLNQSIAEKEARYLEALADPGCGWFYKRNTDAFEAIPRQPIAYWIPPSLLKAFIVGNPLHTVGRTSKGLITGDNGTFLRLWWECALGTTVFRGTSYKDTFASSGKWFACTKGGPYRKWFGNTEWTVNWKDNGNEVREAAVKSGRHWQDYADELKFAPSVTWTDISSSVASFRFATGVLSEHAGMCDFILKDQVHYVLAFLNSSIAKNALEIIAPTLHFNAGDIDSLPLISSEMQCNHIEDIVRSVMAISECDWNNTETAWDFDRHPLI